MRKGLVLLIVLSLSLFLGSCSIDSWGLDKDVKEQLLADFYDYINNDESHGFTYRSRAWSCVNCRVFDGGVESWGDIVENESITNIFMNNDTYVMIQTDNYMSQYYYNDNLYLSIGNTKTKIEASIDDLKLHERHLYIYNILKTILDYDNVDTYIKSVSAIETFTGYVMMTFEFDLKELKAKRIIDEDTSVSLTLEFVTNREDGETKVLDNMNFIVQHGQTIESIKMIAPDLESIVSENFPEDLNIYE